MRPLRISPFLFFLLFPPSQSQAACGPAEDPAFETLVGKGDYAGALHLVLQDLHVSATEAGQFFLDPGVSERSDDRHGQSDPETQQSHLDPGLFLEGMAGACQGVAHELQHLRQFKRDTSHLKTYYAKQPPQERSLWVGCDVEGTLPTEPALLAAAAYPCLEDNDLSPHLAAYEIEAVLAQIPFSPAHLLRDEDLQYLQDHLKLFADHTKLLDARTNEGYYLPAIKKEDIAVFCRGAHFFRRKHLDTSAFDAAWNRYCHK